MLTIKGKINKKKKKKNHKPKIFLNALTQKQYKQNITIPTPKQNIHNPNLQTITHAYLHPSTQNTTKKPYTNEFTKKLKPITNKHTNTAQTNTKTNVDINYKINLKRAWPTGLAQKQNQSKHKQLRNINTKRIQYTSQKPSNKKAKVTIIRTITYFKKTNKLPLHPKTYPTYQTILHKDTQTIKHLKPKITTTTTTAKPTKLQITNTHTSIPLNTT